jgi:transposase
VEQATTIGLDIAKYVFQAHGANATGHALFRKRVTRAKLLGFLTAQAPCVVAMEACAGAHHWAREIGKLIVSTAITALVPAAQGFPARRAFAAWLGLTPLQKSTGGKQRLGAVSKRGERTIRRLLIIGASAVVQQASRRGAPKGSWLAQMLARKPKMLVTVALANKMARIV